MTGYQEIVTDPSFAEQIVTFTAPMVGNYGIEPARSEAARPHARAVVMREARGPVWTDWLLEHGLVALSGVDTRTLTVHLRSRGAMRAIAVAGEGSVDEALRIVAEQPPMAGRPLAAEVSTPEPYVFADRGRARIAVVDYGCKRSILNRLATAGAAVTVFPHSAQVRDLHAFDGILLSNGPGDPVLALATGHETYKLPFGHRGANHPVLDKRSDRVLVTSQNHGFAVSASPAKEVTHVSLYDGTVEGLDFPWLRARSVQFHPEAGPGPHDAWPLLDEWVAEVAYAQAA